MKRRATDSVETPDQEIKQQRATPFQWATLWLSNLPMLIKVIMLLGVGGVSATQAPKIYQAWNGTAPIAEGETVVPRETISPELRQSLESMNAAIKKLQAADKAGDSASSNADKIQDERLDKLERLVQ